MVMGKSLAPEAEDKKEGSANKVIKMQLKRQDHLSGASWVLKIFSKFTVLTHFGKPVAYSSVILFQESWMIKLVLKKVISTVWWGFFRTCYYGLKKKQLTLILQQITRRPLSTLILSAKNATHQFGFEPTTSCLPGRRTTSCAMVEICQIDLK